MFASEADWMDFVKALAANRPMFVASFGPTPARVESGERRIGISMPKYIVTKAPAPLDRGPRGGQPLLGTPRAMALAAKAPHPAAGRAFVDYWLSKKAMQLLATEVGEYVLAPGVHPPIEGIEQAKVLPPPEKRGLGMVFQTYAIWPHMTVFENVACPLRVRAASKARIAEKVAEALRFVQLAGVE